MEIKIENLGKLKSADIVIDGITVIAGENNTGKSTISKALYTQFNSFYKYPENLDRDRKGSIMSLLQFLMLNGSVKERMSSENLINKLTEEIFSEKRNYIEDNESLSSLLKSQIGVQKVNEDLIPQVSNRIIQILNISNHTLLKQVVTNRYNDEFSNQINNINDKNNQDATINLKIKNEEFISRIKNNKISALKCDPKTVLMTEAVYIDDPTILDDLNNRSYPFYRIRNSRHEQSLMRKLRTDKSSASDKLIIDEKLSDIFTAISEADNGDLVLDSNSNWIFRKNDNTDLELNNLSMGLKTFVIIKALLLNGSIEDNGTLILDEPEIHLHPEWQILLARIIVLLQKNFGLHILVNTHSPYFMRAIEVYSANNNIADRCRYYQTENTDDGAIAKDVTMSTDDIYRKLSGPFVKLEREEFK
jgi:predicted ATPase